MIFHSLAFFATVSFASAMEAFTANIMPLSDEYTVEGITVVMIDEESTAVFYGGHLTGLESSLDASTCNATNGCGLHIHVGMSCENVTTQGGHLYETSEDPWAEARFSTTMEGEAVEGTWLEIGTNDVNGRIMIVHNEAGDRVACGILESVGDTFTHLSTTTSPLGDDSMTESQAVVVGNDMFLCYAGMAQGLETDIVSFMDGGGDCNVTNGCGTHIHSGDSCTSNVTQGGHWYETDEDPWLMQSYLSTSPEGMAYFGNCLVVGAATSMSENQPFIIHDSMGYRVSCGILESVDAGVQAPTPASMETPSASIGSSSSTRRFTALKTLALLFLTAAYH